MTRMFKALSLAAALALVGCSHHACDVCDDCGEGTGGSCGSCGGNSYANKAAGQQYAPGYVAGGAANSAKVAMQPAKTVR